MDDNDVTKTVKTERLQAFIESEVKSCSFNPELITPEYVYRMWGEKFSMADIENGLTELRSYGCTEIGDWGMS